MEIFTDNNHPASSMGERIKTVRKSRKMTQKDFAASLGIVQGFLCSIERGRKVPSDTLLIALQHLYGIDPDWLNGGSARMSGESPASRALQGNSAIPLYKKSPNSLESIPRSMIREHLAIPDIPGDCFAFEYTGEFMSPTIRDGDIIIVKPGKEPVSGDIILIVGKWGDSFLRRYRKVGNEIICSADNSSYSAFKADTETKILGVVHVVWRKIKI